MGNLFLHVLQMSIYGSIAIIVVLILRRCFNNLPKRITFLFWLIPGLRLICPLNFDTIFSVMNVTKLSDDADVTINKVANAVAPGALAGPADAHTGTGTAARASVGIADMLTDPKTIAALIWLAGIFAIATYLTVKTVRMMKALKSAKIAPNGRYYVSDAVDTSFVLGIIRPRIYMQAGLTKREELYILQHERIHIRNFDHITRLIGVLAVCVYWFNPLIWLAFAKMSVDMEMRCDEAVIDRMGDNIKKDYCRSIVIHALKRDTASRGVYAAFAGDNYNGREIKMRINNLVGYKKVSKIVAVSVIVLAFGLTIALSTKAQNKKDDVKPVNDEISIEVESGEEKVGAPVSVPGNILTDLTDEENLENYGKEEMAIPDDVVYSDEGRPYSKTYDYKDTPVLNRIGEILKKDGFDILDPDTEYLDKEGNVQTGRELYVINAYKEDAKGTMLLNVYMVSEGYARDSYNEIKEKDGIWYSVSDNWGTEDSWYVIRLYDPKTGVMIDASGNYEYDWESAGLFDTVK